MSRLIFSLFPVVQPLEESNFTFSSPQKKCCAVEQSLHILPQPLTTTDLLPVSRERDLPHINGIVNAVSLCLTFLSMFFVVCLFLAVLGFHYSVGFSLICGGWGATLVVVHRLLIAMLSLVAEHGP